MASCPKCGFDLTAEGSCPVCGYGGDSDPTGRSGAGGRRALRGSADGSTASGSAAVDTPPRASGRVRITLIGAIVAVAALLAVGGYFLSASARANSASGASAAAAGRTAGGAATASGPQAARGAAAAQANVTAKAGGAPEAAAEPAHSTDAAANGAARQLAAGGATSSGSASAAGGATAASSPSMTANATAAGGTVDPYANAIDLWPPKAATAAAAADAPEYDITKRTEYPPLTSEDAYVKWMLAHYPGEQEKFLRERWVRASIALRYGHITHRRILMGFLLTPREWFTRPWNVNRAYENVAMPIGYGQTISGPDLVARMTDYLDPQPDQRVLEIGTGSGYQSAFLSELSNYVYTIEIVKPLAEQTNQIYLEHTKEMPEYANIHRRIADGYYGWPKYAPFDRIIVTCGIDHIPPDLLKELKPGGIMVIPIGPPSGQTILKITKNVDKDGNVTLTREDIYHGTAKDIFVPFTAEGGGTHFLSSDAKN